MRIIHELSDHSHPRIAAEEAVPLMLKRAGLDVPDTIGGQLELLRMVQIDSPCFM